jgi:hypothetical protein
MHVGADSQATGIKCVKLLDVDELDGIAEDVGIRTEEDSVIYVLKGEEHGNTRLCFASCLGWHTWLL